MTFAAVLGPFYNIAAAALEEEKEEEKEGKEEKEEKEGAQSCAHPCLHLLHRDQDTQRSKAHHTTTPQAEHRTNHRINQ